MVIKNRIRRIFIDNVIMCFWSCFEPDYRDKEEAFYKDVDDDYKV
jgi:hypothetical protein